MKWRFDSRVLSDKKYHLNLKVSFTQCNATTKWDQRAYSVRKPCFYLRFKAREALSAQEKTVQSNHNPKKDVTKAQQTTYSNETIR